MLGDCQAERQDWKVAQLTSTGPGANQRGCTPSTGPCSMGGRRSAEDLARPGPREEV